MNPVLGPVFEELEQHIENIRLESVAARFRPEEVAAASSLDTCPAGFEDIIGPAQQIVAQFDSRVFSSNEGIE